MWPTHTSIVVGFAPWHHALSIKESSDGVILILFVRDSPETFCWTSYIHKSASNVANALKTSFSVYKSGVIVFKPTIQNAAEAVFNDCPTEAPKPWLLSAPAFRSFDNTDKKHYAKLVLVFKEISKKTSHVNLPPSLMCE